MKSGDNTTYEAMKEANQIVAGVLTLLEEEAEPGVSTGKLDTLAEEYIHDHGAEPAFKGYQPQWSDSPFPGTITASLNEELVHGIPTDERVIEDGDILSIDVGAYKNGGTGDSALTLGFEPLQSSVQRLLENTRKTLFDVIQELEPGQPTGTVGSTIESSGEREGYGTVKQWGSHFIGHEMHMGTIPNHGSADRGPTLEEGMYLAIEPMFSLGSETTEVLDDGWTVATKDGSHCAHYEHTVAVTKNGSDILSLRDNENLLAL